MRIKKILLSFLFLFCAGCQTPGYYITDSPLQLPDIRRAVNAVIGKPRQVSINGREMVSEYHDAKFSPLDEAAKNKDRYQTKVSILGPRRPYEVNIVVVFEQFEPEVGAYVVRQIDESLSRQRAIAVRKALNLSLEKQSGFDGERPF